MKISAGKLVSFHYILKNEDGEEIESTDKESPFEYLHGADQIITGLENALEGLEKGDKKKVKVSPEDGYGLRDEEAFVEVPKEHVPEDAHEIGAQLQTVAENGDVLWPTVVEIDEDSIVLDFNHPLAGQTLVFEVTVVNVADSKSPKKSKQKSKSKKPTKTKGKAAKKAKSSKK